ncbi:SigE family RNA polymerase sigma factor [Nocardioides bigeumensis]|uniref:SigE family RNA polymerase sigma factor n=1 Tax=Nocardioides bigeumensis TaxID=433657 RepID=A0ABN2YET2_9ACTN
MSPGVSRQPDGFDEFAVAAWPRLLRSAYLLCGDHHLAEDLVQTALARTYARWRHVRRDDAMAYARTVLVNLNIDRMRRKRPVEVRDALPDRADPARTSARTEDRDEVVRLLAALTERERRVVVLRHYFDLSEADVARELGVAAGTVKSTLSRALAKLRVDALSVERAQSTGTGGAR